MNVNFTFEGLRLNIGDSKKKLYPLTSISKNDRFPFILDKRLTDQVKITVDNIQFKFGIDYQMPLMIMRLYDDIGHIINNYTPYMTNQHIIFELKKDKTEETNLENIFTFVGYIEEDPCELEDYGKGEHTLIIRPHYYSAFMSPSPARSFKNKTTKEIIETILTDTPYNFPRENLFLDSIDNKGDWIKLNGESDLDFINRTLETPYNTKDTNFLYKFWVDMNDKVYLKSIEKSISNYTDNEKSDGDIVYKYPSVEKTKFVASTLDFKSVGASSLSDYNNTTEFIQYEQASSTSKELYVNSMPIQKIIGQLSPYETNLKYFSPIYNHDMLPNGMGYGQAVKNKESTFPYMIAFSQEDLYMGDLENGVMFTVRTQNNVVQTDVPSLLSGGWVLFNKLFEIDSDNHSTPFKQTIVLKRRILK